jgi:hypothetical protein
MRYLIATHLTGKSAARLHAKVVFHRNSFHRDGLCLGEVSCALIEKPQPKVFSTDALTLIPRGANVCYPAHLGLSDMA